MGLGRMPNRTILPAAERVIVVGDHQSHLANNVCAMETHALLFGQLTLACSASADCDNNTTSINNNV
jgi:hypothetical protein